MIIKFRQRAFSHLLSSRKALPKVWVGEKDTLPENFIFELENTYKTILHLPVQNRWVVRRSEWSKWSGRRWISIINMTIRGHWHRRQREVGCRGRSWDAGRWDCRLPCVPVHRHHFTSNALFYSQTRTDWLRLTPPTFLPSALYGMHAKERECQCSQHSLDIITVAHITCPMCEWSKINWINYPIWLDASSFQTVFWKLRNNLE